jgi:hypothetical protein
MAAKKDNLPAKPVVSKVPLPISDSALVIDLPDGQKLVIGKMSQGTVIEVATWRGVGRPDSRTNRMMFGMSTAEIEDDAQSNENSSQVSIKPENLLSRVVNYPIAIFRWLFNIQKVPTVKKNGRKRNKLIIEPNVSPSSTDSTSQEMTQSQAKKKIVPLILKVLSQSRLIAVKVASRLVKRVKNLKALKNGLKPPRANSGATSESQDREIEKWLASITSKPAKELPPLPSKESKKRSQKK